MRTRLRLYLDWGITFEEPYQTPEHGQRKVYYAGRQELEEAIKQRFWLGPDETEKAHSRKQERAAKNSDEQAGQPSQSTVTECSFTKRKDGSPPG